MAKPTDSRFNEVEYFVEADSNHQEFLWLKHSGYIEFKKELSHLQPLMLDWVSDTTGKILFISEKVGVTFSFAKINGHMVCFYYPEGMIVDWAVIDAWLETHFPNVKKTNMDNWHLCVGLYHTKIKTVIF